MEKVFVTGIKFDFLLSQALAEKMFSLVRNINHLLSYLITEQSHTDMYAIFIFMTQPLISSETVGSFHSLSRFSRALIGCKF